MLLTENSGIANDFYEDDLVTYYFLPCDKILSEVPVITTLGVALPNFCDVLNWSTVFEDVLLLLGFIGGNFLVQEMFLEESFVLDLALEILFELKWPAAFTFEQRGDSIDR